LLSISPQHFSWKFCFLLSSIVKKKGLSKNISIFFFLLNQAHLRKAAIVATTLPKYLAELSL